MSEQAIKKILITGANGFIGGSLMRYYQNQGQDVVGVDLVGNADDIVEVIYHNQIRSVSSYKNAM